MTLSSIVDKFVSIIRRDWLSGSRYRIGFFMQFFGLIAELLGIFYLAKAIGPGYRPDGIEYYPFLLIGTGVYQFLMSTVNAFGNAVRDVQVTGTIEVLMSSATPAPLLVVLSAFSALSVHVLHLAMFFITGFILFGVSLSHANWPAFAGMMLASLAVAVGIGMILAAVQLHLQKSGAVIWLLGSVTWLLSGTMFPISALPRPILAIASALPITHSLMGLRIALIGGESGVDLARSLTIVSLWAVILVPLGVSLFAWAVRDGRLQGTLSFY